MKKIKSIFCGAVLSICLVGNVFALGTFNQVFTSFFDGIVKAFVSSATTSDDCPVRTCGDCKPFDPNCRPGGN